MLNKNEFNGALARAGMTNKELAGKIGVSKNTISSRITGKSCFNTDEIDKICEVLNITEDSVKAHIFLYQPSQYRDKTESK